MTCTFCGNENRPENRFCGMCGARLERRQSQRRTTRTENLKCVACNHINEAGHKFCGMCGSRIERRVRVNDRRGTGISALASAGESRGRAVALANAQLPTPEISGGSRSRAAAAAPAVLSQMEQTQPQPMSYSREPVSTTIGGPSFLGLGSDPHTDSGEYLLEDESSSGSGLRKLVLLVVLLAIAGLVFVQWRATNHVAPKPLDQPKPNPATVPRPEGKDQGNSADKKQSQSASNDTEANGISKKDANPQAKGIHNESLAAAEELKHPAHSTDKTTEEVKLKDSLAHEKAAGDSDDADVETPSKTSGISKPSANTTRAAREKPSPALTKAQRYLQGKGVRQSCAQGMMYLKAATEQNDPNAAVQMAALYASGHCVQQDRVKAYQWFATAHNQEPDNQWIAKNMNQLWAEMTPQQRRQF